MALMNLFAEKEWRHTDIENGLTNTAREGEGVTQEKG